MQPRPSLLTVVQALLGLALFAFASPAAAQQTNFWHPLWYTRMAVSDQSTSAGTQALVWSVSAGDSSVPFILTVKNAEDSGTGAWNYTITSNLTSGPAAVSWTDGSTARQRIVYSSGGNVQVMNYDSPGGGAVTALPNVAGYTIPTGDVAAVTWSASGTQRIAIASYAAKAGVNGFLCFWEAAHNSSVWSSSCTTNAVLPASIDPLPDIVGVAQGTIPVFFFRNANNRPARARRTGTAAFTVEELVALTTIGASMFATQSQVAGAVDIGVIRSDNNRVTVGRLTSATAILPSWTDLPALPSGAVPNTVSNVALDGAKYAISADGTNTRTQVAVVSTTGRMHTIRTTSNAGTAWATAWDAGRVPGNGGTTAPEQIVFGVGPTLTAPANNGPRTFLIASGASPTAWATVLQEYQLAQPRPFLDHVRLQPQAPLAIAPPSVGATESSIAGGPVGGFAAAISRANPVPWGVWIASTTDNGSTWGLPQALVPAPGFGGNRSITDPTATHGGLGGHTLHFADLEITKQQSSTYECINTAATTRAVTYRRGLSGAEIANGTKTFVVGTAVDLDHPGLGVTVNANDAATAHVLYWDITNNQSKYWTLAPGDVTAGPFNMTAALPAQPAGILTGANQTVAYGWTSNWVGATVAGCSVTMSSSATLWPKICRMNGSSTSLTCGTVGSGGKTPVPATMDMPFGAAQASTAPGVCPVGASYFKAFNTWQPVALAADPVTANQIYAAYQAKDPSSGRMAIFFTRNTDSSLAVWTTPVKVDSAAGANQHLFNPAITVDYEGTIVVTYSRMTVSTASTPSNGQADVLVRHSKNLGSTFSTTEQRVTGWDGDNLPYHCGRKAYFLGEYHLGDVVGGRAQHIFLQSYGITNEVMQQSAVWFSAHANLTP